MVSARPDVTSERADLLQENLAGRYPPNLLCTDDEALGEGARYFSVEKWAQEHGFTEEWADAAEAGLLQIAKASRGEKNAGCEGLPEKSAKECGRVAHIKGEHITSIDRKDGRGIVPVNGHNRPRANTGPCVKPVRLFAYLAALLCPSGGIILDPFLGSGTTLVAAVQGNFRGIGIDLSPEYCDIARARVAHAEREAADKRRQEQPILTLALDETGK
jgi:hypothetical protein